MNTLALRRRTFVLSALLAILASPAVASDRSSASSLVPTPHDAAEGVVSGVILENFPNSWHQATLGVEDAGAGTLFYAHEQVPSNTLWFVDATAPHAAKTREAYQPL